MSDAEIKKALLEKADELVGVCRKLLKGASGLEEALDNSEAASAVSRLHGFLMALFIAKICDEKEIKKIWKSAVEILDTPPTEIEKFIESLENLDNL